ncbi:hypothetical protein EDD76_105260 [Kineothrix alysoides]|uniref:Uncharacterized protein n=1 Tax=Kineothrix alysoides TaxID=1469948 RepID=A0A4R1R185_9FIRM|nr:hypothetical protein [Kineothrix alysoides]TCL59083.1 hypothetical protein EDD76_105260 [Kineothrix alysoides]
MAEGIEVFENTFRHQIQSGGEIRIQKNLFTKKVRRRRRGVACSGGSVQAAVDARLSPCA